MPVPMLSQPLILGGVVYPYAPEQHALASPQPSVYAQSDAV